MPIYILTAIAIVLSSDIAFVTSYDGVLTSIILSALFPSTALTNLFCVVLFQDSPGMNAEGWYISFSVIAFIVFVRNISGLKKMFREYEVYRYSVFLVLYGACTSFLLDNYFEVKQSADRPYYIIALLILIMINSAFASMSELLNNTGAMVKLKRVIYLLIAHSFFISLAQILFGATLFSSSIGDQIIENSAQLIKSNSFGISRITGSYLSPNAFALSSITILALFPFLSRYTKVTPGYKVSFSVLSFYFATIAFSRALLLVAFLVTVYFTVDVRSKSLRVSLIVFCVGVVTLIMYLIWSEFSGVGQMVSTSFRFSGFAPLDSFGYRSEAWAAVVKHFTPYNWVFGTGMSHWRVFFQENVGFALADPHSSVFSYAGTFGIPGVYVFYKIVREIIYSAPINHVGKFGGVYLLSVLIIKDLFSIPVLFGNTPITFVFWMILIHVISNRNRNSNRDLSRSAVSKS